MTIVPIPAYAATKSGRMGSKRSRQLQAVPLMPLKILHFPLVLLGSGAGLKRSQIAAFARAATLFPRVKPVLAGRKFTDHRQFLLSAKAIAIRAPL